MAAAVDLNTLFREDLEKATKCALGDEDKTDESVFTIYNDLVKLSNEDVENEFRAKIQTFLDLHQEKQLSNCIDDADLSDRMKTMVKNLQTPDKIVSKVKVISKLIAKNPKDHTALNALISVYAVQMCKHIISEIVSFLKNYMDVSDESTIQDRIDNFDAFDQELKNIQICNSTGDADIDEVTTFVNEIVKVEDDFTKTNMQLLDIDKYRTDLILKINEALLVVAKKIVDLTWCATTRQLLFRLYTIEKTEIEAGLSRFQRVTPFQRSSTAWLKKIQEYVQNYGTKNIANSYRATREYITLWNSLNDKLTRLTILQGGYLPFIEESTQNLISFNRSQFTVGEITRSVDVCIANFYEFVKRALSSSHLANITTETYKQIQKEDAKNVLYVFFDKLNTKNGVAYDKNLKADDVKNEAESVKKLIASYEKYIVTATEFVRTKLEPCLRTISVQYCGAVHQDNDYLRAECNKIGTKFQAIDNMIQAVNAFIQPYRDRLNEFVPDWLEFDKIRSKVLKDIENIRTDIEEFTILHTRIIDILKTNGSSIVSVKEVKKLLAHYIHLDNNITNGIVRAQDDLSTLTDTSSDNVYINPQDEPARNTLNTLYTTLNQMIVSFVQQQGQLKNMYQQNVKKLEKVIENLEIVMGSSDNPVPDVKVSENELIQVRDYDVIKNEFDNLTCDDIQFDQSTYIENLKMLMKKKKGISLEDLSNLSTSLVEINNVYAAVKLCMDKLDQFVREIGVAQSTDEFKALQKEVEQKRQDIFPLVQRVLQTQVHYMTVINDYSRQALEQYEEYVEPFKDVLNKQGDEKLKGALKDIDNDDSLREYMVRARQAILIMETVVAVLEKIPSLNNKKDFDQHPIYELYNKINEYGDKIKSLTRFSELVVDVLTTNMNDEQKQLEKQRFQNTMIQIQPLVIGHVHIQLQGIQQGLWQGAPQQQGGQQAQQAQQAQQILNDVGPYQWDMNKRHPPLMWRPGTPLPVETSVNPPKFNGCDDITRHNHTLRLDIPVGNNNLVRRFVIPLRSNIGLDLYDTLLTSKGRLVFPTQDAFTEFVNENCFTPENQRILLLRHDVTNGYAKTSVDMETIKIAQELDKIRYIDNQYTFKDPYQGWTFWDSIPRAVFDDKIDDQDTLGHLHRSLVDRYTSHLCKDTVSQHKLGWFLLYWMLNLTTEESFKHMIQVTRKVVIPPNRHPVMHNDELMPGIVVLNHAINILDLCFGVQPSQNPIMLSGMFQPFMRGFIDNPDDPGSWRIKEGLGNDRDSRYLQLPSDPNDPMATILRAHPNTVLVRLSPTKAMHLDFIIYRIVDNEKDKKQARKYDDYVVLYSIDMLNPDIKGLPACPAPMILLLYMMNHMLEVKRKGNLGDIPVYYPMGLLPLLDRMMRQKTKNLKQEENILGMKTGPEPNPIPFEVGWGPIMANFGSARYYYSSRDMCEQSLVPLSVPLAETFAMLYKIIPDQLDDQKPLFDILFTTFFAKKGLVKSDGLAEIYHNYLQTAAFCDPMFATIDNFGDPGCSTSPTWMIEHVPQHPPNPLMQKLYDYVYGHFYENSLWECERTVIGALKQDFAGSEPPEVIIRNQHIWHLVRWLGFDFFLRLFKDPKDRMVILIENVLKLVMNSSFAYPFITPDMAENMLEQLGPAAKQYGFVLRLSTSQTLAFERRTHNPEYDPAKPYMPQYKYQIIQGKEWQDWFSAFTDERLARITRMRDLGHLFQDLAIKTPMYTESELQMQLREYILRYGLYHKYDFVLIRNLRAIEQTLSSCNVNVQARMLIPGSTTRYAFRDATNEEELNRLDIIVEKAFPNDANEWKALKSRTLSVNALGEGQILGLVSDACRPGTYPRIDFNKHLDRPICDDNPSWIFDQPLLSDKYVEDLLDKTKKGSDERRIAKAIKETIQYLKTLTTFGENWCVSGTRGDRNISTVINWLGYDTIQFIYANMRILKSEDKTVPLKTPADYDNFMALDCILSLSENRVFHLLLTPPEADILASTYPGFSIVSLSASTPHALLVTYVDPADILQIKHTEITMKDVRPLYRREIDLSLIVNLLVFQLTGTHLAPAVDEVTTLDRAGCKNPNQTRPTNPYLYTFKFEDQVTNQYASQILSMLMAVSLDIEKISADKWVSTDDERWRQQHPNIKTIHDWKVAASKFVEFAKALPGRAWKSAQDAVYKYNQWWFNPVNYWYSTDSVEGQDFSKQLKQFVERFLTNEAKYAQQNFKPTEISHLIRQIGAADDDDGPTGLTLAAIQYREREFQGAVYRSKKEEKSFVKSFKEAVFAPIKNRYDQWRASSSSTATTIASGQQQQVPSAPTVPDTIYDDLRLMQRLSPPAAAQRLYEKIQSGVPLGSGEIKIGVQLGMLDDQGRLLQRGSAPGFALPRAYPSAGPMSDFQVSGPPFQEIRSARWKQYNEIAPGDVDKLTDFEQTEGCADNGPDYIFPAFDVDGEGRILPRCGRPGWMSSASPITQDQFNKLHTNSKRLLIAIRSMAAHWCPTVAHELRLWRWIGISCLGKHALEFLQSDALDRLDDPSRATDTPIRQLSEKSREEQRRMIQEYREQRTKSKRDSTTADICKKRILFLQQMISSNILFPYIPDSKNARVLASYNPERVVIMLGWGKSGSVICMRDGHKFMEQQYQAEDMVDYMQYVPTTVRLRIFKDFYGGLAASNYDFYTRVLHQSGKQQCLKSLADMKRFAVRAALSLSDQRQLDEIYAAVQTSDTVTPEQRQKIEQLKNISLLLQAKNLNTMELYLYEEIRKLESMPGDSKQAQELAERLYKSKEVDARLNEAEQFEALALCQRPEFVPYLRRKLKEKYPELTVADIEAMDREHLCRVLINNPSVEQMKMPVLVWQIKNVPEAYQDRDAGGMLNIWTTNPGLQREINGWLMTNYGITLEQIRQDNRDTYTEEQRGQQARLFQEEQEQRQTGEEKRIEEMMNFREFLTNGAKCPYILSNGQNLCETTQLTTNGEELMLKGDGDQEKKSIGVVKLFSVIYSNFCHPGVPLLMNDFEFILQSYHTLNNYFMLRKYAKVPTERNLFKQCKIITSMYNKFMDDAVDVEWLHFPLVDILKDEMIVKYYRQLKKAVDNRMPLHLAWSAFAHNPRTTEQQITFTFTVLLVIAESNGIVTLTQP